MCEKLEKAIGFRFKKPEILKVALTHKSFAAECKSAPCNERLEFLGDSILSAVVAHRLYESYPRENEGSLSKRKSALISGASLVRWAQKLDLGSCLFLGVGEEASGGRARPSILCNAMEALIGAIYLDGGYSAAQSFIERWLAQQQVVETDYKSRLQETLQKRYRAAPIYEVLRTSGPEHDKTFMVTVRLGRRELGNGSGKNKKEAEQSAAQDALKRL